MRLFASTRRSTRAAVAIVGAAVLTLSACSSSSTAGSSSASKKPGSSASPSASATAAPTTTADFPTVKGAYGVKPTLTFPFANPSKTLQVKVLSEGTGPVVAKNQLLIADYLGQIWRGKVFDNSYDRKQPIGAPIGVGQVLPGWDKALVGKKVGSRVLLVIPPLEGYGTTGNSDAGIKGTDTLAFVVDIVSTYSKTDTRPDDGGAADRHDRSRHGDRRTRRPADDRDRQGRHTADGGQGDRAGQGFGRRRSRPGSSCCSTRLPTSQARCWTRRSNAAIRYPPPSAPRERPVRSTP